MEHVLRKLGAGQTVESILEDHPHLAEEDVFAAVHFAADYIADETVVPVVAEPS